MGEGEARIDGERVASEAGARGGRTHARDARRERWPRAHQLECRDRRPRVSRPVRSRARPGRARSRHRALVRGLSREPLAVRPARAGRAAGAGPGGRGGEASAKRSTAAVSWRTAPRGGSRTRCRSAASRRCTAPRTTRSRRAIDARRDRAQRRRRQPARRRRRAARCCRPATSIFPGWRLRTRRWASRSRRRRRSPSSAACGCCRRRRRAAAAAHAPRSAAVRLRHRAKAADRARQRDPPSRASGVPRLSPGFRKRRGPCDDGAALRREGRRDARAIRPPDRASRR